MIADVSVAARPSTAVIGEHDQQRLRVGTGMSERADESKSLIQLMSCCGVFRGHPAELMTGLIRIRKVQNNEAAALTA